MGNDGVSRIMGMQEWHVRLIWERLGPVTYCWQNWFREGLSLVLGSKMFYWWKFDKHIRMVQALCDTGIGRPAINQCTVEVKDWVICNFRSVVRWWDTNNGALLHWNRDRHVSACRKQSQSYWLTQWQPQPQYLIRSETTQRDRVCSYGEQILSSISNMMELSSG